MSPFKEQMKALIERFGAIGHSFSLNGETVVVEMVDYMISVAGLTQDASRIHYELVTIYPVIEQCPPGPLVRLVFRLRLR